MVRQDILAGLRNALERGENLEQAKASFISAGYASEEVEEAASALSRTTELREVGEVKEVVPIPGKETEMGAGAVVKEKKTKKLLPYLIIGAAVILISVAVYFLILKK